MQSNRSGGTTSFVEREVTIRFMRSKPRLALGVNGLTSFICFLCLWCNTRIVAIGRKVYFHHKLWLMTKQRSQFGCSYLQTEVAGSLTVLPLLVFRHQIRVLREISDVLATDLILSGQLLFSTFLLFLGWK